MSKKIRARTMKFRNENGEYISADMLLGEGNSGTMVSEISKENKESTTEYPNVKAVCDYVAPLAEEIDATKSDLLHVVKSVNGVAPDASGNVVVFGGGGGVDLDPTLTDNSKAAPAGIVGEISNDIAHNAVIKRRGKNLYNPAENTANTLDSSWVGNVQTLTASTSLVSQKIDFPNGQDITFYGVRSFALVNNANIVTQQKTFTNVDDAVTIHWNDVPSGTTHIWICTYPANANLDTQVEIGDVKTPYEPYDAGGNEFECDGEKIPFAFKDDIPEIDENEIVKIEKSKNLFDYSTCERASIATVSVGSNQTLTESPNYYTQKIEIPDGRDITIYGVRSYSLVNNGNIVTKKKLLIEQDAPLTLRWDELPDRSKFVWVQATSDDAPYITQVEIGIEATEYVDYVEYNPNMSNILYKKKYMAYGDSYTQISDVPGITYDRVIRRRNLMSGYNCGISGSTMAVPNDGTDTHPFSVSRYLEIPDDADYVTLAFGINDVSKCTLGTIDDSTNTTFYGAWNIVLEWILRNRPYTKVGIIIFHRADTPFYHAILEISCKWGIPVLDTFGGTNTSPTIDKRANGLGYSDVAQEIRKQNFYFDGHSLHPDSRAHIWNSTMIENFLRGL